MMGALLILGCLLAVMSLATGIRPRHLGLGKHNGERRHGVRRLLGVAGAGLLLSKVHAFEHIALLVVCAIAVVIAVVVALLIRRRRRRSVFHERQRYEGPVW